MIAEQIQLRFNAWEKVVLIVGDNNKEAIPIRRPLLVLPSNTIAIGYGDPAPLLSAIITKRTNKSRKSRWMSFVLSNLISLSLDKNSIHRSAEGQQPATGPFDEHINVLQ